jgi:hypothetical protein
MPVFIKKIGEEKYFQDGKHNKKFNEDNHPHFSSPTRHIPEPIIIKAEYSVQKRRYFSHILSAYYLERELRYTK